MISRTALNEFAGHYTRDELEDARVTVVHAIRERRRIVLRQEKDVEKTLEDERRRNSTSFAFKTDSSRRGHDQAQRGRDSEVDNWIPARNH